MSTVEAKNLSFKAGVQKFGRFMSGMIMPNIGAFIAWGLITTLFIPTGWLPNERLSSLVGPMITYLLPLLIAYTGGKMVWGIRGGAAGVLTNLILKSGAVASPSPGSIFALMAVAQRGSHLSILLAVTLSTAVSFFIAMPFVRKFAHEVDEETLNDAQNKVKAMKADSKGMGRISQIFFACDAGMGSSAMGANKLTKMLKAEGVDIKVEHCSVDDIPRSAQLIICHRDLKERVLSSGTKAQCVSVSNLVNAPEYKEVVTAVVESHR